MMFLNDDEEDFPASPQASLFPPPVSPLSPSSSLYFEPNESQQVLYQQQQQQQQQAQVVIAKLVERIKQLERIIQEKDELIIDLKKKNQELTSESYGAPHNSGGSGRPTPSVSLLKEYFDAVEEFACYPLPNRHAENKLKIVIGMLKELCLVPPNATMQARTFIERMLNCTRIVTDSLNRYARQSGVDHSTSSKIQGLFVHIPNSNEPNNPVLGTQIIRLLLGIVQSNDKDVWHKSMGWRSVMKHITRVMPKDTEKLDLLLGRDIDTSISDELINSSLVEIVKLDNTAKELGAPLYDLTNKFMKVVIAKMKEEGAIQSAIFMSEHTRRWDLLSDILIHDKQFKRCIECICNNKQALMDKLIICLETMLSSDSADYEYCLHLVCKTIRANTKIYGTTGVHRMFEHMMRNHGMCTDTGISERIVQMLELLYPKPAGFSLNDGTLRFRKCLTAILDNLFSSDQKLLFKRLHRYIGYKRLIELMVAGAWIFLTPPRDNNHGYPYQEMTPSADEEQYIISINNFMQSIASSVYHAMQPVLENIRSTLVADMNYSQAKQRTSFLSTQYKIFGRVKEFESLKNQLEGLYIEDKRLQLDKCNASNPKWMDYVLTYPVVPFLDLTNDSLRTFSDIEIVCTSDTFDYSYAEMMSGISKIFQDQTGEGVQLSQTGLTGYNVFCSYKREELKKNYPFFTYREVNSELGRMWKGMSETERRPFNEQARINKLRKDQEKQIPVSPTTSSSPSSSETVNQNNSTKRPQVTAPPAPPSKKAKMSNPGPILSSPTPTGVLSPQNVATAPMTVSTNPTVITPHQRNSIIEISDDDPEFLAAASIISSAPPPITPQQLLQQQHQQILLQQQQQRRPQNAFQTHITQYPSSYPQRAVPPQPMYTQLFTQEQRGRLKSQIYCLRNHILRGEQPPDYLLDASAGINPIGNLVIYETMYK